jgi:hypothetical protein
MYRETKRETQRETQLKTQRETQLETQLKTQRETQLETQLGTQQETQRNRNTTGTFRHVAFLLLCVLPVHLRLLSRCVSVIIALRSSHVGFPSNCVPIALRPL